MISTKSDWLANSDHRQNLIYHCIGVAIQSLAVFRAQNLKSGADVFGNSGGKINYKEKFEKDLISSAIFHDLGKIDLYYQEFIKPRDQETDFNQLDWAYPKHQEISYALLTGIKSLNYLDQNVKHAVYYHHASARQNQYSNSEVFELIKNKQDFQQLYTKTFIFIDDLHTVATHIGGLSQDSIVRDACRYIIDTLNKILEAKEQDDDTAFRDDHPPRFFREAPKKPEKISDFRTKQDAENILLRSVLVTSDRMISKMPNLHEKLFDKNYVWKYTFPGSSSSYLQEDISKLSHRFPKPENSNGSPNRSMKQEDVCSQLTAIKGIGVLQGPAGCGKTKMALQWVQKSIEAGRNPSRLFIVVPRSIVAKTLYEELIDTNGKYQLGSQSGSSAVELITGEDKRLYKNGERTTHETAPFEGHVIILTIDQVLSVMFSHQDIEVFLELMNSAVVFDEFHEFFSIPGMIVMLKVVLDGLSMFNDPMALLVSATPNPFFLNQLGVEGVPFANINSQNCTASNIRKIPSFNLKPFFVDVENYIVNKDGKHWAMDGCTIPQGSMFVFNTATDAQNASLTALKNQSNPLKIVNLHGKFTPHDRREARENLHKGWDETAEKTHINSNSEYAGVVFAGPIIQASLDVSTGHMYTEECTAENMLQRLGRVNRWGNRPSGRLTLSVLNRNAPKNKNKSIEQIWDYLHMRQQITTWSTFIQTKLGGGNTPVFLSDLYAWYDEYHQTSCAQDAYQKDLIQVLIKSSDLINKNILAPRKFTNNTISEKRLGQHSLRGRSSYIVVPKVDFGTSNSVTWLSSGGDDVDNHITMSDDRLDINPSNHFTWIQGNAPDQKNAPKGYTPDGYTYDISKISKYKTQTTNKNVFTKDTKTKLYKINETEYATLVFLKEAKSPSHPLILNTVSEWNSEHCGWVYVIYNDTPIGLMNIKP